MTTVNNNELVDSISGFAPHISSRLLAKPDTRPIFTSIVILLKIYSVLMLIFGSLGNLLSFCVLLRANMRRYSTFCYLACLALVDLFVIITFCTNLISLYHFNNDIQDRPFACKLFAFCIYFLPQYSSWILVAVSIDRVISAKYLRLAKTWSKPKHSVLVTLLLGLGLGILNSHFFLYENNSIQQKTLPQHNRTAFDTLPSADDLSFLDLFPNVAIGSSSASYESFTPSSIQRDTTLQQQQTYDHGITIQSPPSDDFIFDVNVIHCSLEHSRQHGYLFPVWVWIDLLMNVFLPFTAMIACTIIIILTLVRSSTRAGSTSARRSRRRRNISVMLITVNLVFISLTAPIVIFFSLYDHIKGDNNDYLQTILVLIKVFCIILMNLNHSVNIIIYSVTAKEFRTEMANFLKAVLYSIIGKPVNPNDFAYIHDDGTFSSRFRRLRQGLFHSCRVKLRSGSPNTTDSSGLHHTTAGGLTSRPSNYENSLGNPLNKRRNDQRLSSVSNIRYSETSTTHRTSHRLTVQYQPDSASCAFEREDVSLQDQSNSIDD